MDEFRKPFEYDEEKRGLLLLFIIMIVTIDTSITIAFTLQVYRSLKHIPAAGITSIVTGAAFLLFILFTTVYSYKLKKNTAKVSKTYLVTRALFTVSSILIIYIHSIGDETLIGNGPQQFRSLDEMTTVVLVYPLAYTLLFSAIWFLYFSLSKRFKKTNEE